VRRLTRRSLSRSICLIGYPKRIQFSKAAQSPITTESTNPSATLSFKCCPASCFRHSDDKETMQGNFILKKGSTLYRYIGTIAFRAQCQMFFIINSSSDRSFFDMRHPKTSIRHQVEHKRSRISSQFQEDLRIFRLTSLHHGLDNYREKRWSWRRRNET
jgi:hypothetical protein